VAVTAYMQHVLDPQDGRVTRWELPGLNGFNFLLENALGGGGIASVRIDPQGKAFAQQLLDFPVPVPARHWRTAVSNFQSVTNHGADCQVEPTKTRETRITYNPYCAATRLFAGQSIVVTGGGSGIGRCTAHELAALGANVALVGRKPEKL
jgi:hypothetical protein